MNWPDGRRFAFTAIDDTDWSTIRNVKPVYDLLTDLGLFTTKSVWVYDGMDSAGYQGQTCEDRDYLDWVFELQKAGFEISIHNAAPVTSGRERTMRALDRFRELFGRRTLVHCNHRMCEENIYWGENRVTGPRRRAYNWWASRRHRSHRFRGHVEGDPLFWGDFCRERVSYVRNFVYQDLNTLKVCPEMPYHDPGKPFVNYWFAAAEGGSPARFLRNYTCENIDRLVQEGGASIAYVHFGAAFVKDGTPDPEFRKRLEYIASKGGWFAPVGAILDFLRQNRTRDERAISSGRLAALENRWLADKFRERFRY